MKEDETIDTFTAKLTTLVNKAASLGHTIEDSIVVRKLLNVVPDRFLQIVASIEQYSDLDEMSVDEAIGRLKTFEKRLKSKKEIRVDSQESLEYGHFANKCPSKKEEQSNLIEEDLEPTLLMATVEEAPGRVGSENLDGGVTESMSRPGIKEDIYAARTPIGRQSVGSITNQKHDQSGFMIDHNNEGGSNRRKIDLPGCKDDHKLYKKSNEDIMEEIVRRISNSMEENVRGVSNKTNDQSGYTLEKPCPSDAKQQQDFKSEIEMLHNGKKKSIDSFVTRLTGIINKAASVGLAYEDSTLVRKLLNAVPDRFLQIVASIEQYSDLDEMSVDEAIGRLKTFEERLKSKKEIRVDSQESLMFTRHEGQGKPFRERGRGGFYHHEEIPFSFKLTVSNIEQQGVGSENLDGGVTESMSRPGIKEDIYAARTPIGRQSVGSITNQKHDQSGFMIDHNNEGGSNQKNMINLDLRKITTMKVEVTEEKNDLPGCKDDHKLYKKSNEDIME
ncbi:hypothetical protein Tco_1024652 [Tanacetum coccineum]